MAARPASAACCGNWASTPSRAASSCRSRRTRPTSTPSRRRPGALPRRPRDRAPHQEPRPLERHGDGRARQQHEDGIGGHISTFASAATLYEVGFNHFFRGRDGGGDGDLIYFQGHASPGIYARAFLEGRISAEQLDQLPPRAAAGRRPVVLPAPVADARLLAVPDRVDGPRADHGHLPGAVQPLPGGPRPRRQSDAKVWAFLGDGETDEPESLGAITLASREKLDNLIFVINCNLQRLDGPVRGNGKIIQELEAIFRGAGWNVIKVHLGQRLGRAAGQRQRAACSSSAWARSSTASTRSTRSRPARTSASTSSAQYPRAAGAGRAPDRRAAPEADARRPRSAEGLRRLQGARSSPRACRRSSWPRPSRATASARPARARTSPTSRRS